MKLIHLSDLHLGKRFCEYPLIDEQREVLSEITDIIFSEKPDAVIIAGDVYDKSVPSAQAVELFDDFLCGLAGAEFQIFIIAGNHDSPERLSFASRLIDLSGVHISPVYSGNVTPFTIRDDHGEANIYMLPFIKPATVSALFPEERISSYTDAVAIAVREMRVDASARNVLVAHQFVTGAKRSESEEISVGGLDNVDASVFECFDYVALGHIHSPQNAAGERVRYCGTPLKYSFSEAADVKSLSVVELGDKGELSVRAVPVKQPRNVSEIKGKYLEIMDKSFYDGTTYPDDYLHVILTDEDPVPNVSDRLASVYSHVCRIDYDNRRTAYQTRLESDVVSSELSPLSLFEMFYTEVNGSPMTDEQRECVEELCARIEEAEI